MKIGDVAPVDGLASEALGGGCGQMQVRDDRVTERVAGKIGDMRAIDDNNAG